MMPTVFSNTRGERFLGNFIKEFGFEVNVDPQIKSDYYFLPNETLDSINVIKEYETIHNITDSLLPIVDKSKNNGLFAAAGFDVLQQFIPKNYSELQSIPLDKIIIKPIFSNNRVVDLTAFTDQLGYIPVSKQTLLDVSVDDEDFWNNQNGENPFIFQEVAEAAEGDDLQFTILPAIVNGNGQVVHLNNSVNNEQRSFVNRHLQSTVTYSNETVSADIADLRTKLETLITQNNIKNQFCSLQFVKNSDGKWYPIDFQYRRLWFLKALFDKEEYKSFVVDVYKFIYDVSTTVPVQPVAVALRLNIDSYRQFGKNNVWVGFGNTKDKALIDLEVNHQVNPNVPNVAKT